MDRGDIKLPIEQQRSSDGFAINSTQFLGMKDRKREQAIAQEIRAKQEQQKSARSDLEEESPKTNPIKVSQIVGTQRSPRAKIQKQSPREVDSNQIQRKQLVPFQQISYSPVERVTTEEREEGALIDYFAGQEDVKVIHNLDKADKKEHLQDYLIKEEVSDIDSKRITSQRKVQPNFQNRKKSNTVHSLQFDANLDNDYSTKHRNTDIQDELGEAKDVIFQINQTDVNLNTTVRLINDSVNSGDITRAGPEMGTANVSKNSPKLAQSSIGISVEKGQSILNEADNSIKTGPDAFNNAYDALNYKSFVNTFHAEQKGYKFFMANKNRYENSKQDFKEKFSMFNNTQSQLPQHTKGSKVMGQFERFDSRRHSNIDKYNSSAKNDSESLMIKSKGLNPYLKKPNILTNTSQFSPKEASRGSDQNAPSTQHIAEEDIIIGKKKQSVISHVTGSFGGSQGFDQTKSQMGDPLNVTKKAITKMPKIVYSNEGNHGSHFSSDGNVPQVAKTPQSVTQNAAHQDLRRNQNNYSSGSASNSQQQKLNLISSFQGFNQRYQDNIRSMNERTQLMEVSNVLMSQQYSSPNKVAPSSKYNNGLSLQNRGSITGGSQMSFQSQMDLQRLMNQTQMHGKIGQNDLFTPQTKRVVGPGGFGARIKKRTQSLMNYKIYLQNRYNYNDYYLQKEKKPRSPRLCAQQPSPPRKVDGWRRDASFGKIKGNDRSMKMDTEDALSTFKPDNQTFSVRDTSEKELTSSPMARQYFGESGIQSTTFNSSLINKQKKSQIPKDYHFNKSQILKATGLIPESESKGFVISNKNQNKDQLNVNTLINQLQGNLSQSQISDFQLQELGEIRLKQASRESRQTKSFDKSGKTTAQPLMSPQSNGSNILFNPIDINQVPKNYLDQIVLASNTAVIVDINNRSKNGRDDSNYNSRPNSKMSKPSTGASGVRNLHSQKRRQVLLSNSRGLKKEFQERDRVKTSEWPKQKIVTGGNISHFSSPSESNDFKQNANKIPSEIFTNVAHQNNMLPLVKSNANFIHLNEQVTNQNQLVKAEYVVLSGGQRVDSNSSNNFDLIHANLQGQIGDLKQIQKQKKNSQVYEAIPQIQAIDMQQISELQKLHELQIQNKNLQHQLQATQKQAVESETRRKSLASSTIRLSTQNGGNKSNFRYNEADESKLSTSLNLNSNRGVTQKEIENALYLKNEFKRGSVQSKRKELSGADLESKTFWASKNEQSPTLSADVAVNEFIKSINAHRNIANTSQNSGKGYSRFRDDELEDWRRNTMNDKFYFLSAASKKSRMKMLQSMPDFKMTARAKIDMGRKENGNPGSYDPTTPSTKRQKIEAIREQLIGEYSKRAGEKGELDQQLLDEFDKEFLHQVKTQFMVDPDPKEDPQPTKRKKQKPKARSPNNLRKSQDNSMTRQFTKSPQRVKKIDRPWQITEVKSMRDNKYNKPIVQPRRPSPPSRPQKQQQSMIPQPQTMTQPLQKVTSLDGISQKSNQEQETKSIFNEILKKEVTDTNKDQDNKKKDVPIEKSISKFTEKLNQIMNVDMSQIRNNLKDSKRVSSQYGAIAGGLPENIEDAPEGDESQRKRPLSPFTAMFNEGAGGDAVLASTIQDVKAIYRDALRSSGMCLQTYKNAQQIESQVVTITTKARPAPFQIQQCQFTNIIIDGLRGRAQPIIINFSGVKGELLTLVSTSHKFPTPQLNQASFFNTNQIRFSTAPGSNNQGQNGSVQRFTTSQLYLAVETTHFCPQVQVHISFGNSSSHMKEQVEKKKSAQITSPRPDSSEQNKQENQTQSAPLKKNTGGKQGEPDPDQALFDEIMRIIVTKSKRPLDTYSGLQKQIKKMVEDEDTANKFIKHVEGLRQQRLQNLEKERAGEAFVDERKDLVALNIESQSNFYEFEMNRKLINFLRFRHREEQSLAKKKQLLIEFRDSAIRFLNRNNTMKQEKAMIQHLEDEQKKRTKKLKFYCTMVIVQKYVQNILWKEFETERAIVHRNIMEEKAALVIQREMIIFQSRLNSRSKEIPPELERKFDIDYEIEMSEWATFNARNSIRQRLSFMVQSIQEITAKKSRPLVYKCLVEGIGVFDIRDKFQGTDTRIQRIQRNIKKYRAHREGQMTALIEHFEREQARISLQFTLFGQPGKESPFKDLATDILKIPEDFRDQLLKEFAIMSGQKYHDEFVVWREQLKEIQAQGLKDDRFGWRMPLVCPEGSSRIVYDFSEVGYDPQSSWMVKKCAALSYRLTSTALKTQNQADFMAIYREHNKDKLKDGNVRSYDYKREKYQDLFKVEYYMAPVRGSRKQWEYAKWKKGWTKPKPPREFSTEEKAFELTEVEGQEEVPETPYQIMQKKKQLEEQIYEEEWDQNRINLAENPDEYTAYPDQPMKRYFPVPYLMHQLIFKALESWKGAKFFSETLKLGSAEEQFSWSSVAGAPPGMAKIEKQIVQSGLIGSSRMTLDGAQGSDRLASQISLAVSQEE